MNAFLAALFVAAAWTIVHNLRRAIRSDRSRNDRVAAQRITRLEPRPEPGTPGRNEQLLAACWAICPDASDTTEPRKEDRP